tara:strand:- start:636 stop:2186 length:1551 start_codon:yes stop_codon:yes gene_type:complete
MYVWIIVTGGIFSFIAAMGIGANDVANAYATSVGSKSLTVKQAVFLATIFESSGAILMGSHVTKTIRKGIADYECFEDDPGALMYGCMCVCLSVAMWLFIASMYEMPVSTTHSCVGGMIGMTMVLKGPNCVTWYEPKDTFPYIGGVSGIILSWIISPLFSAIISGAFYGIIRETILRSKNSFNRTTYLFPILIGFTITLNSFFIIYKGAKGLGLDDTPFNTAAALSFGIGGGCSILIIPFANIIKKNILSKTGSTIDLDNIGDDTVFDIENKNIENKNIENKNIENKNIEIKNTTCCNIIDYVNNNLNKNVDSIVKDNEKVNNIHTNAEKFHANTEEYFKSLQIFTAICCSFSHGANDVANAIGPFAAIYMIGRDGAVIKAVEMGTDAYWMLGFGGVGISIGLLLYGYKIMYAIGLKLCKITPSRGVAIELASAFVIITGSRLEIPLSTTHCQVGATIGVAALEDPKNCSGINWTVVGKTFTGWILTLVIVGSTTALLTAQGTYAPELGTSDCGEF